MARVSIIVVLPLPLVPMCPGLESPLIVGTHSTTASRPLDMAPHDDDHHGERSTRSAVWTYAVAETTATSSTITSSISVGLRS